MILSCIRCTRLLFQRPTIPARYASFNRSIFKPDDEQSKSFGYFLMLFPVASFCLGTWQIQRRKWKLGLIEELENKTIIPPIDFPEDLSELSQMEYRQVHLRGRFNHSKEMYIQPRSLVKSGGKGDVGGLFSKGHVGSWVVTPFVLADRDTTILVNRGWIPMRRRADKPRPESSVSNEIDLVGIVRSSEKRAPLASKHLTNDNKIWSRRDVELMADTAQCEPIFIDAVLGSKSQPGEPIGGQTRVTLRNEHMSYIVTWYSLSAATAYLWYKNIFSKFRPV